ncbi:MAG: DNA translocase FtsK [Candidatus Hydrogenedentales bacterium]
MDEDGIVSLKVKRFLWGVILLVVSLALFFALLSDYDYSQQNADNTMIGVEPAVNWLGPVGATIAGLLVIFFGDASHIIYAITFLWALRLIANRPFGFILLRFLGLSLCVISGASFIEMIPFSNAAGDRVGGAFGSFFTQHVTDQNFWLFVFMWSALVLIGFFLSTGGLGTIFSTVTGTSFRIIAKSGMLFLSLIWKGLLKISGLKSAKAQDDALTPITDFCEQIPEGAFPPEPPQKWFRRTRKVLRFLLPQITVETVTVEMKDNPKGKYAQILEEDFQEEVFDSETEVPAAPAQSTAAPELIDQEDVPSQAPIIETYTPDDFEETESETEESDSDFSTEDSPFGEIPDLDFSADDGAALDETLGMGDEEALTEETGGLLYSTGGDEVEASAAGKKSEETSAALRNAGLHKGAAVSTGQKEGPAGFTRLRRKKEAGAALAETNSYPARYTPPALDLFKHGTRKIIPNLHEKLGNLATKLEACLATFNTEAKVTHVSRGPTVTRFELEPAPGTLVNRFTKLIDNIALALKAKGVRVEAPIPGKGRVGIEISNDERDPVVIRELLEHKAFNKRSTGLNLALGKDIAGEVCIADLTQMPHLLVAGATGAGKTICIKALLASLLYQHTPDELQLMLVDPKMVELSIFNDIPHLITPVVTDPKKAATSLQWLITEMEERYHLFTDLGVRNIEVYNDSVENGEIEMEGSSEHSAPQSFHVVRKLPYIVCIIDELADLMILARGDVEEAIMRLAQLARAVGIHLIIATQRPSVDVLTGVIKANFPARISFQVSSRVDSRCILDEIGAERLIGMGDMLYLPKGQSKPVRIQGAFVSDDEMTDLINYLKQQAPPQYRDEIQNFGKNKDPLEDLEQDEDPLLEDAIRVVLDTGQASISMVQRRLRVGYTRAARLIDMMELKGIVGPHTGSKAREILVATTMKE